MDGVIAKEIVIIIDSCDFGANLDDFKVDMIRSRWDKLAGKISFAL